MHLIWKFYVGNGPVTAKIEQNPVKKFFKEYWGRFIT